jgi:hypothetical protein
MEVAMHGRAEKTAAVMPPAAQNYSAMQLQMLREGRIYNGGCRRIVMCVRMESGL